MPEVIIESPDIERIVAQRVRPVPPRQLGVRIPDVLPQAEIPEISPPPRPVPKEREPDMDLTNYFGGLSRIFGDPDQLFESGIAFLKKGNPVEALTYFNKTRELKDLPRLKAAGQFWAAEVLIRLGRFREARLVRKELLRFPSLSVGPYRAAARYALADESCQSKEYQTCLNWLDRGVWAEGGVATEEARFLHAWALLKLGIRGRAMEILINLTPGRRRLALRALMAIGHLYFKSGDFTKAARAYLKAESSWTPSSAGDKELLGEALHGIGWTHLRLGQLEAAGRAFSLAIRRHPKHPLRTSIEAGAVAVLIETQTDRANRSLEEFIRKYPENQHIGPLRLHLAWAQFRRRNYSGAGKLAASVSDEFPLGRIYRLGRVIEGLSLYHQGKVRKAYGVLRTGAERPPTGKSDRPDEKSAARSAAMATAFAAFRLKDYSGAQTVLEHWAFLEGFGMEGQAADPEAALWYGEAAFEANDLIRARRAFEKISNSSKVGYRAKAGLAWIHYRNREWEKAAAAFDQVFSMKPSGLLAPEALARAGESRFNLGDYSGALRAFDRVENEFAGGPVARKALLEKGKLLFRRDRYSEAVQAFERYLRKYPKSKDVNQVEFWKALIPFRLARYKTARTRLLAFAERNPKSPLAGIAYLRIGDAYYNEGKYLQADRIYRLMKRRYPKHPRVREATYSLILTRLQRKNFKQFISDARNYIERYGNDDMGIALGFQIGEVLLARGDLTGALRAY
ncbi:MAG: tetratricopeptide repeat protein, partial [bacterium]